MSEKYELYTTVDMRGNETNVMEIHEPMTEDEIDVICRKYEIDVVENV